MSKRDGSRRLTSSLCVAISSAISALAFSTHSTTNSWSNLGQITSQQTNAGGPLCVMRSLGEIIVIDTATNFPWGIKDLS